MRYGIAIIIIIFLAIVSVVVVVNRTGSTTRSSNTPSRITKMASFDHDDGANISWTQQGRLVGEDQRRAVRVTISRNTRRVEVLDGYNEQVERIEELPNTPAAFESFTRALDHLNFGKERKVTIPDERGICPLGNRYMYRLSKNGEEVMRTWSDTCSLNDGPYGGITPTTIAQLFKNQITDYSKFTTNVSL